MSVVDLAMTRAAREEAAWTAFTVAQTRAQTSGRIEDGIAAGRAFRAFLDLFLTHEQRDGLQRADEAVTGRRRAT